MLRAPDVTKGEVPCGEKGSAEISLRDGVRGV